MWTWFDLAWPWICLVAAFGLLVLLFGTDRLRGDKMVSRWKDQVWISWLAVPIYMIHNTEEYGIDMLGRLHSFPPQLCIGMKLQPYPDCPITPSYYLAVNITLFWIMAPICAAFFSRRHPLIGLSLYGVIFFNGLFHIGGAIAARQVNPGLLTATVLFLPLSLYVARTFFRRGRLPWTGWWTIVATGALIYLIIPGAMEKWLGGASLVR